MKVSRPREGVVTKILAGRTINDTCMDLSVQKRPLSLLYFSGEGGSQPVVLSALSFFKRLNFSDDCGGLPITQMYLSIIYQTQAKKKSRGVEFQEFRPFSIRTSWQQENPGFPLLVSLLVHKNARVHPSVLYGHIGDSQRKRRRAPAVELELLFVHPVPIGVPVGVVVPAYVLHLAETGDAAEPIDSAAGEPGTVAVDGLCAEELGVVNDRGFLLKVHALVWKRKYREFNSNVLVKNIIKGEKMSRFYPVSSKH